MLPCLRPSLTPCTAAAVERAAAGAPDPGRRAVPGHHHPDQGLGALYVPAGRRAAAGLPPPLCGPHRSATIWASCMCCVTHGSRMIPSCETHADYVIVSIAERRANKIIVEVKEHLCSCRPGRPCCTVHRSSICAVQGRARAHTCAGTWQSSRQASGLPSTSPSAPGPLLAPCRNRCICSNTYTQTRLQ